MALGSEVKGCYFPSDTFYYTEREWQRKEEQIKGSIHFQTASQTHTFIITKRRERKLVETKINIF
jgi:hypothetical protein